MAYSEYRDAGQVPGRALYQLSEIGVPTIIVENLMFMAENTIHYNGKVFATYDWFSGNVPVFQFAPGLGIYIELQHKYLREHYSFIACLNSLGLSPYVETNPLTNGSLK